MAQGTSIITMSVTTMLCYDTINVNAYNLSRICNFGEREVRKIEILWGDIGGGGKISCVILNGIAL